MTILKAIVENRGTDLPLQSVTFADRISELVDHAERFPGILEDVSPDCTVFFLERLVRKSTTTGQVFWLPDQRANDCTFPQLDVWRLSQPDTSPSRWLTQRSSLDTAGRTATDSHRLPYSSPLATSRRRHPGLLALEHHSHGAKRRSSYQSRTGLQLCPDANPRTQIDCAPWPIRRQRSRSLNSPGRNGITRHKSRPERPLSACVSKCVDRHANRNQPLHIAA